MAALSVRTTSSLRGSKQAFSCPAAQPLHRGKLVSMKERRARPLKAYVEPSVSFAVVQQALAYAVVLGAEGAYTRTQLAEGAPGRPEIKPVAAGAAGTLVAVALVATNNDFLNTPGLIIGLLTSGAMMAYCVKRTLDTKSDETEWPGPKAWPATLSLISFFALNIFIQALRTEL